MKSFYCALIVSISCQLAAQVNLSNGLVACYALNGNASEPVNNLTGTLNLVTPATDRFNNPGSACSFNGSAQSFITLPDTVLLKSTTAMSFGGWINTNALVNQYIFYTRDNASGNFEAYSSSIHSVGGSCIFRGQKGATGNTIIADGSTVVNINTWYHVYVSVDNTSLKLYVNGNLEATIASTFSFDYMAGKKVFLGGSNESSFNLPFSGSLDNVRFYNRILNAAEITQLYMQREECAVIATGVQTTAANTDLVTVYPNPANNKIKLETINSQPANYFLHDVLGNIIAKGEIESNGSMEINIQAYPKAMYFLEVHSGGQKIVKKIIKE